jgi:hypothetical protein
MQHGNVNVKILHPSSQTQQTMKMKTEYAPEAPVFRPDK